MEPSRSAQSRALLSQLVRELARLVDDIEDIPVLADLAGVPRRSIKQDGRPITIWDSVVREADKLEKIPELIEAIESERGYESDIFIVAREFFAPGAPFAMTAAAQAETMAKGAPPPPVTVSRTVDVVRARFTLLMNYIFPCMALQMHTMEPPLVQWDLRLAEDAPMASSATMRLVLRTYIEGFSAETVDTVELQKPLAGTTNAGPAAATGAEARQPSVGPGEDANAAPHAPDDGDEGRPVAVKLVQRPVFLMDRLRCLTEVTQAQFHAVIETPTGEVLLHQTAMLWILSRNSAPLAFYDAVQGEWRDASHFLGAFVTPNRPEVMRFVRSVAAKHLDMRLLGYQGDADVDAQVEAVCEALKNDVQLVYVNSVRDFNPDPRVKSQRLRLPRECLEERQGNDVDIALLVASVLEAVSLNPALVVLPSHIIVGWETAPGSNQWRYLDPSKIPGMSFAAAVKFGNGIAQVMQRQREQTDNEQWFRRLPLNELRGVHGIFPLE